MGAAIQSCKVKILEAKGFIVREATEKMSLAVGHTQGDGGAGRTMRVTTQARLHAVAFHGVPQACSQRVRSDLADEPDAATKRGRGAGAVGPAAANGFNN